MDTGNRPRDRGQNSHVRVQVLRVGDGVRSTVRALSDAIGGILTHYQGGRGRYCPVDACPLCRARSERTWKGYTPVELWEPASKRWIPWVLEITEALELDVRGRWRRGQTWELHRQRTEKKKHFPVTGQLIREDDPAGWRPSFDVRPVLFALYHVTDMQLDQENPMPARVVLEVEPAGAEPRPTAKRPDELTREEREATIAKIREARNRIGLAEANGKTAGAHP